MEEFGIFTDEGCIEDGFVSREAAEARAVGYRASGDAVSVHPICHDHPEQIAGQCEECDAEDDALGCSRGTTATPGSGTSAPCARPDRS